ncbi:MAG: RelA/SpoT family protein [Helicobacteraceae bacterium]|jgi:RelA/SpoT family (p)ppGpp synthetase|nr:RelA/SpoT family protein [Helicobacteraceae bacterium]
MLESRVKKAFALLPKAQKTTKRNLKLETYQENLYDKSANLADALSEIRSQKDAENLLYNLVDTPLLRSACDKAANAHLGQTRKSGEPYIVHPLLVAAAVAHYGGDESMVIAAVLHDAIEDTDYKFDDIARDFSQDVARLVDGLTKIDRIREENLLPSDRKDEKLIESALTFRKMLIASIKDARVLVIKLCDRMHNMLTLDALSEDKQRRIAEETLVVYAPIAHRLGIGRIKSLLEDRSFAYIFPKEYEEIDRFLASRGHSLRLALNAFITEVKTEMLSAGFDEQSFEIATRIKHHYSIYTKMQRKGVKIDEVLDLMAARILVRAPEDCYKTLGILHTRYRPLMARFKEYIALPKENGYQTLHTTLFHKAGICEVQIRTFDMHQTSEYGIAAHWKYKASGSASAALFPKLSWLESMQYTSENPLDFYELAKNDLFSDEIEVYSPQGDTFTLPRGATALDFAFMVHSDVGLRATAALVNRARKPLLTEIKNGDLVQIETGRDILPRCSWIEALKTSRAKNVLRHTCNQRSREIDRLSALSILRFCLNIKDMTEFENWLKIRGYEEAIHKLNRENSLLEEIAARYNKEKNKIGIFSLSHHTLKRYKTENIEITSPKTISGVDFEHCCQPKYGDQILMFYGKRGRATIHHKLCENAYRELVGGAAALKASWTGGKVGLYNLVVNLENKKGSLLALLTFLANRDVNITTLHLGNSESALTWCDVTAEFPTKTIGKIKAAIEKRFTLILFNAANDVYKNTGV